MQTKQGLIDFLHIIEFALQQLLCDEIAPFKMRHELMRSKLKRKGNL
ncbi:MAG: hypothetical protein J6038_03800 [Bacilli bacterium]|nr:hypothetical protein [Bacilli bacterium]